jgi:hypothetical protein
MLSNAEITAGERLRADFWFAQMTPRVTVNWRTCWRRTAGGAARPTPARTFPTTCLPQERVRLALRAAGPDLAGMLIDLCCHLKGLETAEKLGGWPQRSGKVALQIALRQLARHYGLVTAHGTAPGSRTKTTHWGTSDYRPSIMPDEAAGGGST